VALTGHIPEAVRALAGPIAEPLGLEVVDVAFRREARGWVLRVIIDSPGGVRLDDCQAVSERLGDRLDAEGLIDHPYALEVSSPGLDRPLRAAADFVRFAGRRARIRTAEPIGGQRNFQGVLRGCHGGTVFLEADRGDAVAIPHALIVRARLEVDW
jgi:ribosome maturation factor RimP